MSKGKDPQFNSSAMLVPGFSTAFIKTAMEYAVKCHTETNHAYDGKPYHVHLEMVYGFGCKHAHLLSKEEIEFALAGCWVHDIIEDCRQTYNDVKTVCGEQVAEIAYAVTNEKGKTRKERANEKYYNGIRKNKLATFVKICDRLANITYSKNSNSKMIEVYRKEFEEFHSRLHVQIFETMFAEMRKLVA